MSEEEDFSSLPIESRWRHAKWKARQSAYEDVISGLKRNAPPYKPTAEDLKDCTSDSNVIALESGIKLVIATLQPLPANSTEAVSIRQAVARPLAEKGLVAAKPSVKQASLNALLALVESADPSGVVDDILTATSSAKSPKAVAAGLQSLDSIFKEFGSPVADPRPILKVLPKFFGHTDRTVRQNVTQLACSLSRWVGQDALLQVLNGIKPVQLNEVKTAIEKSDFSAPPPKLTKLQVQEQEQLQAQQNQGHDQNEMYDDDSPASQDHQQRQQRQQFDPWEVAEPENVLSKIPADFWEFVASAKWKERYEALEPVVAMLTKTPRMDPNGDYSRIISELLRIAQKDINQMCFTQAIMGLTAFAEGLRARGFGQYAQRTLEAVVEKFKEKKQSTLDVVAKCIDTIFFRVLDSQLGPINETVVEIGMKHKTPQVRIEAAKYCTHLLCELTVVPKFGDLKEMGNVAVKLLGDTGEPIRAAAAGVIAALIKLVGEQKMGPLLDSLDDHKRNRVNTAVKQINVKASGQSAPAPAQSAKPGAAAGAVAGAGTAAPNSRTTNRAVPSAAAPSRPAPRTAATGGAGAGVTATTVFRPQAATRNTAAPNPRAAQLLASPPSRRAPTLSHAAPGDISMGLTSPSPGVPGQRNGRPSLSSTPKIVKRTSTHAEFTPARGVDTFRRRILSPSKAGGGGADLSITEAELEMDVREIARLSAELELEKSLRLEAEKRLARVQVEKDRDLLRLREEISMLKLQLKTQKEEFEVWLKSEERRWSQSSEDMGNKLSVLSLDPEAASSRPSSRPPSRRPPSRVLPISMATTHSEKPVNTTSTRTGNDDWERAVSMTHSLRQRVEQLKQQKQRNMMP